MKSFFFGFAAVPVRTFLWARASELALRIRGIFYKSGTLYGDSRILKSRDVSVREREATIVLCVDRAHRGSRGRGVAVHRIKQRIRGAYKSVSTTHHCKFLGVSPGDKRMLFAACLHSRSELCRWEISVRSFHAGRKAEEMNPMGFQWQLSLPEVRSSVDPLHLC